MSLNLEHHVRLLRRWYTADEDKRAGWPAFAADKWLHLSPAELGELSEQLVALLDTWAKRPAPEDGVQREAVFVFAHGFPGQP